MNALELLIYNQVKNNPALKRKLVGLYQQLLSWVPQSKLQCNFKHKIHTGLYYGFHDKSPFSRDGTKVLTHRVIAPIKTLRGGEKVEIGFVDQSGFGDYKKISVTQAWNWQMTSMLQWYPQSSDKLVIYNTLSKNRHTSAISDLHGNIITNFDKPIVHVSSDASYAISYDFLDVEVAMPGYGVVGDIQSDRHKISVWKTSNQEVCWSMTIEEAKSVSPHPSMINSHHFFHHALFSPDGSKLFFLHRWLDQSSRRWTRLFTVDADGNNLSLQPMDEMVSHITWKNNCELFAYLRWPGIGDGYYALDVESKTAKRYLDDYLNSDGHPTFDEDRGIIITDTYPDRFRNQYLYLFKTQNNELVRLMKANLPIKYVDNLQIDMHPRLSASQNLVCVDGADSNGPRMVILDFSEAM